MTHITATSTIGGKVIGPNVVVLRQASAMGIRVRGRRAKLTSQNTAPMTQ